MITPVRSLLPKTRIDALVSVFKLALVWLVCMAPGAVRLAGYALQELCCTRRCCETTPMGRRDGARSYFFERAALPDPLQLQQHARMINLFHQPHVCARGREFMTRAVQLY